jgi:hypothetical protein
MKVSWRILTFLAPPGTRKKLSVFPAIYNCSTSGSEVKDRVIESNTARGLSSSRLSDPVGSRLFCA